MSDYNVEFRIPTINDVEELKENFDNCDWIDDFIESIKSENVETLKILTSNGNIIGIADF